MIRLTLFSGPECCLCDDAMRLLKASVVIENISVEKKDIYTDKSLLLKYKLDIPVLRCDRSGEELKWPFDRASLDEWISCLAVLAATK